MNLTLIIIILVIFCIILVSYSMENVDHVAISFLGAFISAVITSLIIGLDLEFFITTIEWKVIIIILGMSLITEIAVKSNILEFLAVKLFQIVKGNIKYFFYSFILLSSVLAAIVTDVVVIIILAPVLIRLCRHLKIKSGTYLIAMTLSVKVGSMLTPFGSIEILIIATHFELSTLFFFQYFTIFTLILLGFTAFLLYKFLLSKEENIDPQQKEFMLNLIDTDVIMKNRKMFYINGIAILVIIFLFLILPQLYITAGIGSVILILINKKFTKKSMSDMLKNIDWEILFFLGSIYVTIGCLIEAGFADLFHQIPLTGLEPIFLYLLLFLIITGMSAAVANKPTTLIMLPIISSLIMEGISALPLYFIFIFGITLGGNMVPQGAISHVAMLEIAEKNGVKDLTYRRLFVVGILVTAVMIITSIGYLYLLLFFGY